MPDSTTLRLVMGGPEPPLEKQLARVKDNPAWPLEWPCEQPGMQGGAELEGAFHDDATDLFADVHHQTAALVAHYLESHPDKSTRLHKSLINRLLEPFMWHTVIVSSTEAGWENFFLQRCSPLAQPEIRVAADRIQAVYDASTPEKLQPGEWHTPYLDWEEMLGLDSFHDALRISAARCARVSYLTHDGTRDVSKDIELYDKLVTAVPPHWSPTEHVATPVMRQRWRRRGTPHTLGNLDGWNQLRHVGLPT